MSQETSNVESTEEVVTVEGTVVPAEESTEDEAIQEAEETLGYPDIAAIKARIEAIVPTADENFVISLGINQEAIDAITNAEGYIDAKEAANNIDIAIAALAMLLRNDSVLSSSIMASIARDFDFKDDLVGMPASLTIMTALKSLDESALSLVIALSMNAEYAELVVMRQMLELKSIAEALGFEENATEEDAAPAESTEGTQQA